MVPSSHPRLMQWHNGLQGQLPLSFWHAVCLSPIAFFIHALEDAPRLAAWMNAVPLFEHVTQRQVDIALVFFVSSATLTTYLAVAKREWRFTLYGLVWMHGVLFLHGIAHVIPSIWVLAYTPGFWTAILLNIPVAVYLLCRARKERLLSRRALLIICLLSILLYDPFLRLAFRIGEGKIRQDNPPPDSGSVRVQLQVPPAHGPKRRTFPYQPTVAMMLRQEAR